MFMASRACRKAFARWSPFKTLNALRGTGGVSPWVDPLGDSSTLHLKMFVQKHTPFFFHGRQVPQISIKDAAKTLSSVSLEVLKKKLQAIPDACISHKQLLGMCVECAENTCENEGKDTIKSLEQSGSILVVGGTVYLHPEQIARTLETLLFPNVDGSSIEELRKLEKEKEEIDMESKRLVRNELWGGLGLFGLQTAAFFRLTYWEFSYDVMEPFCFYLASCYYLLRYAFFLKTSRDPTFQSFFASRFKIKQSKVMKKRNFDVERYRELHRICRSTLCSSRIERNVS